VTTPPPPAVTTRDEPAAGTAEVLVAEHDPAVAELIRRYLAREGLRVRCVHTPEQTTAALAGGRAAVVVVLDLTMPGLDAREIRRLIRPRPTPAGSGRPPAAWRSRAHPTVGGAPVICLTAGEGTGSAAGLRPQDIGVSRDACLARPFGPRTLVARVRAAARGARPAPPAAAYTSGRLTADPASRRVALDGAEVALTATEFDVLACLLRSAGRTVTRAALRTAVWGENPVPSERIVDVYVTQLRAKLGPAHGIRTVRGIGYVMDTDPPGRPVNPGGRSGARKPPATIGDAGNPSRGR
jgi:DNA-binding response OmpR family regulator